MLPKKKKKKKKIVKMFLEKKFCDKTFQFLHFSLLNLYNLAKKKLILFDSVKKNYPAT